MFIAGLAVSFIVFQIASKDNKTTASHTIAYGIQRLNKLVVAEQNYSNITTSHSRNSFMDLDFVGTKSKIILKVDIRAQASYDLSKMQVEIDSVNEIIHIKRIPELQIDTFPDVEFLDIDQGIFNQFTEEDINAIKSRAIKNVQKTMDTTDLRQQAHEQLLQNLEEIYLLAHIYGWKIQDDTPYATSLEKRIKL